MKLKRMKQDAPGIRKALFIQLLSKYANVFIQLGITMILARLLTPEEYGVVAIVTVFTAFFGMLSDVGISQAIIQYDDFEKKEHSALLFFSLVLGIVLSLVFIALSPLVAMFYSDAQLFPLCSFASLSILFNSLNMVPNGLLLKQKRFASIGIRLVTSSLVGGIVAIVMSILHCGAFSLVANTVIVSMMICFWNIFASHIHIGNIHFVKPLRKIFKYSAFQTAGSFVNYFSRNLDNLLVGKVISITQLGFYDKAYKLTTYPMTFLSSVVGSVLQPYLVKYKDDMSSLYAKWKQISKALSLIAAPVSALLFSAAYEITILFYGDQWGASAHLLQILSISTYFQMINNPTGAIFQSSGRTDYMCAHLIVGGSTTVVLLILGLSTGNIENVAIGISAAYCLHTFSILFFLVHKTLKASVTNYCKQFIPDICCAAICIGLCSITAPLFSSNIAIALIEKALLICIPTIIFYAATGKLKFIRIIIGK